MEILIFWNLKFNTFSLIIEKKKHGSEDLVVTFKNSQYTADAFKVPLTYVLSDIYQKKIKFPFEI